VRRCTARFCARDLEQVHRSSRETLNPAKESGRWATELFGGRVRWQEEEDAEVFLEEMELVVPWRALLKVIEPFYPMAGWPQALPVGIDAARAPDAELVRAERPCDGGSPV
jgi:hypothetical protein